MACSKMMKNYYEILGIQPGADVDVIKSAYREKARKFHPDTSQCDSLNAFLLVQEAYDTLCEPEKRECYDNDLKKYTFDEQKWTQVGPTPTSREFASTDWNFIQNEFFNLADWREDENDKFLEIILSPREARKGTITVFEIPFAYSCPFCRGTGEVFFQICTKCSGTGQKKIMKEFQLKLPAGQTDGDHLIVDLTNSKILKFRLNISIRVLNSATVFSEIF
jgi:DnaJ-class molecular chaperone